MVDNAPSTSKDGRTIHVQGVSRATVWAVLAAAATTDYAANDVISNSAAAGVVITFSNVVAAPGGSGTIESAIVLCQSTQVTHNMRLYLFNSATLTAQLNDNAANTAIAHADYSKSLKYLDFPNLSTKGGDTDSVITPGSGNTPLHFVCAEGSRNIYGILVPLAAITAEVAGHEYLIGLDIIQD
jgi:hypothetical protein